MTTTMPRPVRVASVARALRAEAEIRDLGDRFARAGIPLLALKGPPLQSRLYGTPAAYFSWDVDLLVPARRARAARRLLEEEGWAFEPENGVLWRLSRAATYERGGVRLDLHWGLHAAHLPAWTLRHLERALWAGASPSGCGYLEPDPESLLVFLAVHVVGHGFARQDWAANVTACRQLVRDWDRAWALARRARVEGALRAALIGPEGGAPVPVLDGRSGRFISAATWLLRGHLLPRPIRDRLRRAVAVARAGWGGRAAETLGCTFAGLDLEVPRGVFLPRRISEELVRVALREAGGLERPVLVDVGTGSGAVALALASARPDAEVHATDVSPRAVRCARRNRDRAGIGNVLLHQGSLLNPVPASLRERVAAIATNVPYVPEALCVGSDPHSPREAVAGTDPDGLGLLRDLSREARSFLVPGGSLVLQLAAFQWESFSRELASLGYEPTLEFVSPTGGAVASARWPG